MNIKRIVTMMSILFSTQLAIGAIITVENVASFPIAVQSLSNAAQWTILQPNKKLRLTYFSFNDFPAGIIWKQQAGDRGQLPGCVYYFAAIDKNKYNESSFHSIVLSGSGVYRTTMSPIGGGQAKLFSTDKDCKSFGSQPLR